MATSLIMAMLGGAVGSGLRVWLSTVFPAQAGTIPFTTLMINIIGSLALGVISALAARTSLLSREMVVFLGAGLCGGFTTFSTFSVELMSLAEVGRWVPFALYAAASLIGGIVAAMLGVMAVQAYTR